MSRTLREATLDTRAARLRLAPSRKPYLSGGGGRVTGLRAKGRGITADMGVSCPDLKFGSDDDWT